MSRMSEYEQEQDERQNLSGADDFEAWVHSIEGSYICPYCMNVEPDPKMCCGEMHMQAVSELTKSQKDELK